MIRICTFASLRDSDFTLLIKSIECVVFVRRLLFCSVGTEHLGSFKSQQLDFSCFLELLNFVENNWNALEVKIQREKRRIGLQHESSKKMGMTERFR